MSHNLSTRTVHSGEVRPKPYGALNQPIVQTATYTFASFDEVQHYVRGKAAGRPPRDEYGRYGNPTQAAAERKLADLEGAERALLFASGMSALAVTLTTLLGPGDHLVYVAPCYHKSRELIDEFLPRWGITATAVPPDGPAAVAAALRPQTRLLFVETPSNPYLRVADLPALAALAGERGLVTVVDATFATPVNCRPLEHGADVVVHSASKYLGGHHDLVAGAVAGPARLLAPVERARGVLGAVGGPQDAYLLLRGLKTLDLRVRQQNVNGLALARFLSDHEAVRAVHYPGLPGHPDHAAAGRLMAGCGGVVSFEFAGDLAATGRLLERLRIPHVGPSLGGVESVVVQPAAMFSPDPVERRRAGLADNLVRYAAGIEAAEDLIADLAQALESSHSGCGR
jgi:cystathionine gamma-synthase